MWLPWCLRRCSHLLPMLRHCLTERRVAAGDVLDLEPHEGFSSERPNIPSGVPFDKARARWADQDAETSKCTSTLSRHRAFELRLHTLA